MNAITPNKWIGQRTIRPDGVDKVTGRAAFAADTTMPGMIWGKILRSPHPHARIKSIDTSKALALPGVKAVVIAPSGPHRFRTAARLAATSPTPRRRATHSRCCSRMTPSW